MRGRLVVVIAVAACCPGVPAPVSAGSGAAGSAAGQGRAQATGCHAARAHVADLYRAELSNPTLVDDNTAMVMKDCAKDPARVAACATGAKTVAELEHTCLIALDPEGTEGDALKK